MVIVPQVTLCDTTFRVYLVAARDFKEKEELIARLERNGYLGGPVQRHKEFLEHRQCYERVITAAATLRQHLMSFLNSKRHLGSSTFGYKCIDRIRAIIEDRMKSAQKKGDVVKKMLASMEDAGPVAPATEQKGKKRKLVEEIEDGKLDYVEPLLSSESLWVFVKPIGGGMGKSAPRLHHVRHVLIESLCHTGAASLWARLDEHGVVQERVVRKDTQMHPVSWKDPRYWIADSKAAQKRIHMEYHCHAKAYKQPKGSSLVRPRKFEFDEQIMTHRIYTEYCAHGDLNNLIEANNVNLKKMPETWIWMVFSALVDCGLAMESDCDAVAEGRTSTQIIHRDLKPANVFLDLAAEDSWPWYPQPKVTSYTKMHPSKRLADRT